MKLQAEEELVATAARFRRSRERRLSQSPVLESPDNKAAAMLQRLAFDDAELITTIANKSKNLKSDLVRDLKAAAASMKAAVAAIGSRTVTDETGDRKRQPRKLRAPRSAAVAVTLSPEAMTKGVTYAQVIARAKEQVNLDDLSIAGIRFKMAGTGARILQVSGAGNGEKADNLARKLRESG